MAVFDPPWSPEAGGVSGCRLILYSYYPAQSTDRPSSLATIAGDEAVIVATALFPRRFR